MFAVLLLLIAILTWWAAYKLTIYALPCIVAVAAGTYARETGAGWRGAGAGIGSDLTAVFLGEALGTTWFCIGPETLGKPLAVPPKAVRTKFGRDRHAHRQTVTLLSERRRMLSIRFLVVFQSVGRDFR